MTSKSLRTMLKMHWINVRASIYVFWAIMLTITVLAFTIMTIAADPDTQINMGSIISVSVYLLVVSLISVNETFRYALGMNVRRKDYYSSTLLMIVGTVLSFGVLSTLLSEIEKPIAKALNVNVSLFGVLGESSLSTLDVFLLYMGVGLCISAIGFFISIISYRFGKKGVLLLGGIALLVFIGMSVTSSGPVVRFFNSIGSIAEAMAWLMIPTAVLLAVSYPLMMRMALKE
ncbi:hypothetical protein [Gorillibacterium timonense]|uniref:hypothetical protein n=1 Tax=Gorillibacterium timonense TaxID=1689269 RepID=UPI00071D247F|nr:hypothetical protein [Gorillibacterium timonense]